MYVHVRREGFVLQFEHKAGKRKHSTYVVLHAIWKHVGGYKGGATLHEQDLLRVAIYAYHP